MTEFRCWVCSAPGARKIREANYVGDLGVENFAITDSDYGVTHDIYECPVCRFRFCPDVPDVLSYYEQLVDQGYETSRRQRSLQAAALLRKLNRPGRSDAPKTALLDVGAGSGILVEEAGRQGYDAVGVEPSDWLSQAARSHGLNVLTGILPHPELAGRSFDTVTLVDVIEHVPDPKALLEAVRPYLTEDGVLLVVTPDASSFVARLLGWRWWHYRLAHIGYFSRKNLEKLAAQCGFDVIQVSRPWWYFTLDYALERINKYLPRSLQLPIWKWMTKVCIPLNFFDSMTATLKRSSNRD